MKIIKGILVTIVILVAIITVAGFLSPSHVRVERSLTIQAPSETVHEQINNLRNWNHWSPWYKMDTSMKIEYNGIAAGAGAGYKWISDNKNVGSGDMTILSSSKDSISSAMNFMDGGVATAVFTFSGTEGVTKVTWAMQMDIGMNPVKRIFGLFMDKLLGPDFEKGLESLKRYTEAMPVKPENQYQIQEEDATEKVFVMIKDSVSFDSISGFYSKNLPAILEAVMKDKLELAGAPTGLFFKWDETSKYSIMAAAIPVKGSAKTKVKGYETYVVPAGKILHIAYYGAYDKTEAAHYAMDAYMKKKGFLQMLPVMEEYVTDPMAEPDTAKWLTNIYYPVK